MKVKELKEIVQKANKIVPSNSVLPQYENIYIHRGELITCDNLISYHKKNIPFRGSFQLPAKKLFKILSKLDKDSEVILHANDEKVFINVDGKDKFSFSHEAGEYPLFATQFKSIGYINTSDVISIQRAVNYASKDELRPALTGVYLNYYIVATDGHILNWSKTLGNVYHNLGGKGIIFHSQVAKVINETDYNLSLGELTLTINGLYGVTTDRYDILKFDNDNESIYSKVIDEKYPDWVNVIPDNKERITVNLMDKFPDFIKSLDLADLQANQTTHGVKFEFDEKQVKIHAEDLDLNNEYFDDIEAEINFKEIKPFKIGFNVRNLVRVLKDVKEPNLNFFAPNKAIVISDNETNFLVMPIMLT